MLNSSEETLLMDLFMTIPPINNTTLFLFVELIKFVLEFFGTKLLSLANQCLVFFYNQVGVLFEIGKFPKIFILITQLNKKKVFC